jgi:hypothetical protein
VTGAPPPGDGEVAEASDIPSARAQRIAEQQARLRRFAGWLLGSGAVLVAVGAGWGGVDFAGAVLLGFAVVMLNFYWTKKVVASVLLSGQPHALLALSFLVKFGVVAAVLFYAILRLRVDGLGVLVGLSALLLAVLLYALELGSRRN